MPIFRTQVPYHPVSEDRLQAASTLVELDRRRITTRRLWEGRRRGAETALVLGVLRRRGTLDAILRVHSTRKLHLLQPAARAALRAGLFELLYFDDSPSHAVVNAAVQSVKALGRPKDAGFVNGVLRGVLRGRRRLPPGASGDPRKLLPRDGATWLFRRAIFPDPGLKPAEFLAARTSTASWIAARRLAELGFERALRCLEMQAATPATYIRPAPGAYEAVREELAAAGIEARPGPHAALLEVSPGVAATDLMAACGDRIVVQDAVASQVASFAAPAAGSRVLDVCAAPGGKATHFAQLVGPGGRVSAWDADEDRLARVAENAARLGLDWLVCERPEGLYDTVLVDAPCSNTAVLARRPEARWRVKQRHLPGFAQLQLRILKDASAHVAPRGSLIYSTCSLEPEENLGVVRAFLESHPGFRIDQARTVYPDEGHGDGGFMAFMRGV